LQIPYSWNKGNLLLREGEGCKEGKGGEKGEGRGGEERGVERTPVFIFKFLYNKLCTLCTESAAG